MGIQLSLAGGGEKEEWGPSLFTPLPEKADFLTATSPMAITAMGQPLCFLLNTPGQLHRKV